MLSSASPVVCMEELTRADTRVRLRCSCSVPASPSSPARKMRAPVAALLLCLVATAIANEACRADVDLDTYDASALKSPESDYLVVTQNSVTNLTEVFRINVCHTLIVACNGDTQAAGCLATKNLTSEEDIVLGDISNEHWSGPCTPVLPCWCAISLNWAQRIRDKMERVSFCHTNRRARALQLTLCAT